jgi:hypothetical protein
MKEKVTYEKGFFTDPHCQASHADRVVYTIGKNGANRVLLNDSTEVATCDGQECKNEVNVGGEMENQGK